MTDEFTPSRVRLALPLAVLIALMWLAAGVYALATREIAIFEIATGPFVLMCTFVFGVRFMTRNGSDVSSTSRRRGR